MMYNNYYKKDIIIPKNNQNHKEKLDKNDIKLKDKSYDNIRDIVINKKRYRNTRKYFKNKTYKKIITIFFLLHWF